MKKIAIFTEGQGELIFTRHLLIQTIGYERLSFECFDLHSDRLRSVAYSHHSPNAIIHYQIINVGTDERVLSAIVDRQEKLIEQGHEIVGLRDMYSEAYRKKSNQIDASVNEFFINTFNRIVAQLSGAGSVRFFFAIMEIEAWLLGMYGIFERMDATLTPQKIKDKLGLDLQVIDPEKSFFRPASQLKQVLALAGMRYDKHRSEMENIVSKITLDDLENLAHSNRCASFASFFQEIKREFSEAQHNL
jgi:hypothetical protein